MLTEHKEVYLSINSTQSVRLQKALTELKIILNKHHFHLKLTQTLSVI